VKEKKDSFYIIETTHKTINETKDYLNVKIFSESTMKHVNRQPPRLSKEVREERAIGTVDPVSLLDAKSTTEQEIKCECKEEKEDISEPIKETIVAPKQEVTIVKEEIKKEEPIIEVKVPTEDEKLDSVLSSVLESIQKKAQKQD
jgi:uncharacterized membrane-anchored protein YjiN (DUF445 family)